ncbi:MAG: hypothetical protein P4M13_01775 [Alphaproteobacteria bacterium]|nr:hypothetical protein [Alphaproteobacteria bacterium]
MPAPEMKIDYGKIANNLGREETPSFTAQQFGKFLDCLQDQDWSEVAARLLHAAEIKAQNGGDNTPEMEDLRNMNFLVGDLRILGIDPKRVEAVDKFGGRVAAQLYLTKCAAEEIFGSSIGLLIFNIARAGGAKAAQIDPAKVWKIAKSNRRTMEKAIRLNDLDQDLEPLPPRPECATHPAGDAPSA